MKKSVQQLNIKGFAILRIVFGLVWAIDAYFKWQPAFISGFSDSVSNTLNNQPALIQSWIKIWVNLVSYNPHHFAIVTAVIETIVAIGLLFGIFTKYILYLGLVFSLLIWATAEGFGGPYQTGSTDIGAAIIYVFVFIALLLGRSWEKYGWDANKN